MKPKFSSLLVLSMEDYCKRHNIPCQRLNTNALLIEQYAGSVRIVDAVILYRFSDGVVVIDLKCDLVADDSEVIEVLLYHNAVNSAFTVGTPYLCPDCGEVRLCLLQRAKDATLSDKEIEQMLDCAIQPYNQHVSIVQNILSGAVTLDDAIESAMKAKVQP